MSTSQDSQRHSHTGISSSKLTSETAGIFKKESHREGSQWDSKQQSQKKFKTPNRGRAAHTTSQTSKIVDQLKESVFQIAREQENVAAPGSPKKPTSPQKRSSPQKMSQTALGDQTNNHNVAFGRSSSRASVGPMAAIQIGTSNPDNVCTGFATVDYSKPESPCKLSVQPQSFSRNKEASNTNAQSPRAGKSSKSNS